MPASERVTKFGQLMSDLVMEKFFVPQDAGYVTVAVPPSQPETLHVRDTAGINHSQAVPPTCQPEFLTVQPAKHSYTFGEMVEAKDPSVGEAEAPEIPDPDDGLTDSEFNLAASKAQDGNLDPKERADAAMMMLFGTRRKCNDIVLLFQVSDL